MRRFIVMMAITLGCANAFAADRRRQNKGGRGWLASARVRDAFVDRLYSEKIMIETMARTKPSICGFVSFSRNNRTARTNVTSGYSEVVTETTEVFPPLRYAAIKQRMPTPLMIPFSNE